MIRTTAAAKPLPDNLGAPGSTHPAVAADPIRILIVEDQKFVADALHALLSRQTGLAVVGGAASLGESLNLVGILQPDVVICEFRPGEESTATIKAIQHDSKARVIFLTHAESEGSVLAAIECGASAVLPLSTAADELVQAVRTVGAGGTLIMPQTLVTVLNRPRATDRVRDRLTTRERQVLNLMSDGSSNREIAARMGISYTTVRSHLRSVASKLDAHSKLEVLVKAQRLELVESKAARGRLSFG